VSLSIRIAKTAMLFSSLAAAVVVLASCAGMHQAVLPQFASRESAGIWPSTTVSINVVVTVPSSASNAKSVSISVNGHTPVISNLSSTTPGCTGTNPLVCTIAMNVLESTDTFAFKTFSGANGTGSVLASGTILRTISMAGANVKITLAGTPSAITLALQTTNPRECNPATNLPLYVMVKDSSANVIIGAYGETVTLKDSNTSGTTKLSPSSLTNSSTAVNIAYNGHLLKSATFGASASGVTTVTDAILKPQQIFYVSNFSAPVSITAYVVGSNGNVTPIRTITSTGLTKPASLALDNACNLAVADYGASDVLVFSADANGNVAPIRTISGGNTLLNNSQPQGIAVDSSRNIWVTNTNESQILEFAAGANGNVAPIKNISGSGTSIVSPVGVTLGPTGKVYVAEGTKVLVFAAGANGNVAPVATITDSSTPFSVPRGVAVDSVGKIYVGDFGNSNLSVFAANANGSSTPLQTISGANTLLNGPVMLSLDYAGNIEVSNYNANSHLVFASTANGNVKPQSVISGSNTNLNGPFGNAL
jgi:6-phosphogluconolactonase (cycloisomerase 2 family)